MATITDASLWFEGNHEEIGLGGIARMLAAHDEFSEWSSVPSWFSKVLDSKSVAV